MSTDPWPDGTAWPTRQLSREQLERRIDYFLETQRKAVLCTGGPAGPSGRPVDYYAAGKTLYMLSQFLVSDVAALRNDPRVCVTIHGTDRGWSSERAVQMFGAATLVQPGTRDHAHAMTVCRWQDAADPLGRSPDQPPQLPLLRLAPERIVYTEPSLRWEDFDPCQVWIPAASMARAQAAKH